MPKYKMLKELPFGLLGHIYGSPMPFGPFDPEKLAFKEFKSNAITTIVILAEEHEYLDHTGKDLIRFYTDEGFSALHLPIVDFGVPADKAAFENVLDKVLDCALHGENVVIHCLAGYGRTGLFLASLAKRIFGFNGREAIEWVRQFIPNAITTEEQINYVING